LDGVDFEAKVGEITAIVSATGAGKTSLAYLIPRFHRPTEGRVLIDGQDLSQVSLQSLRDQVTYVFQDTQLFSDSILENIRYGYPDAPMDRVIEAAKTAGAHDFIMTLPETYETQLGARGAKLSVGQRQRIAIARGLITNAPILILDEPTSALDPETETFLVDALHKAAEGKAVIIIAHRLSTIAHADKVVFLSDGKVVEEGRPSDLVSRPGSAYAAFVRLQSQ
jgi:ABC-type multidrug transport system fused ATPase/permease subunit